MQTVERIYLYTPFERFWHWAQAALIVLLALTGFEVHGTFSLFGYQRAVELHNLMAWSWLGLYAFIIFWHATHDQWKQYIPTTKRLAAVVRYYAYGIFLGEPHPVRKCVEAKHNPLQRLAYLGIAVVIIPVQMATGVLYYLYNDWPGLGLALDLSTLAAIHMAGAFAFVSFLVTHVYMTTTGHSLTAHIKAMCTGWEEIHEPVQPEAGAPQSTPNPSLSR